MPYSPTSWVDYPNLSTLINAARLNNMEAGIAAAYVQGAGGLVNADIGAAAAIPYSKLNLANSIVSADIVDGTIVNADIASGAAIAATKLALPYATYVPTWTSAGTAPAIGNAVVVARYAQIGKHVHCYGSITFGSTSTYGTSQYRFALPVTATAAGAIGSALIVDSSSGNGAVAATTVLTTTTMDIQVPATYLGTLAEITNTSPWTWATSDSISWNLTYEAA